MKLMNWQEKWRLWQINRLKNKPVFSQVDFPLLPWAWNPPWWMKHVVAQFEGCYMKNGLAMSSAVSTIIIIFNLWCLPHVPMTYDLKDKKRRRANWIPFQLWEKNSSKEHEFQQHWISTTFSSWMILIDIPWGASFHSTLWKIHRGTQVLIQRDNRKRLQKWSVASRSITSAGKKL